eukprot:6092400-Amphidinium_carterae.3
MCCKSWCCADYWPKSCCALDVHTGCVAEKDGSEGSNNSDSSADVEQEQASAASPHFLHFISNWRRLCVFSCLLSDLHTAYSVSFSRHVPLLCKTVQAGAWWNWLTSGGRLVNKFGGVFVGVSPCFSFGGSPPATYFTRVF